MLCPYCGSEDVHYVGIEDGGGDFGNAACDSFECQACGANFEGDCVESYDPGLEGVDRPPGRVRRGRGAAARPLRVFRPDDEPPSSGGWPGGDSPYDD